MTDAGRRVKSADKTFAIVETIFEREGATVTEVAAEMDLPKSTVHAHLATLSNAEFLVKRSEEYHVSLKFLEYGIRARKEIGLDDYARQTLDDVASETGESVGLFVEEHGRLVYLDAAEGERSVSTHGDIGTRSYLHDSAAGKAILSHLPKARVEEIIDTHGLPATTEHTITDPDKLFEELTEIRERGIAFNEAETMIGLLAVASPILIDGTIAGAIGVAGPQNRLVDDRSQEEISNVLKGATNEIELRVSGATG